ncbi:TetR/AcrR family transcriptional regulator [Dactylosporangium sp. CA-092794]|uniref:TetR/AcrR family transcriptional regulator n=1 Tax=Dactylosporangium sp. CA-092794 TaxID=3239929 RepID=UPI003D8DF58B
MAGIRRHGRALERALLDAAWDELVENGYAAFTMDAVATRARTSRPVLYRRWADKHELVRAALTQAVERDDIAIPDTGTLRGDTIALMRAANETRLNIAAVLTVHLGGYYQETGTSPADLRESLLPGRPRITRIVLDRAIARGEVPRDSVSDRIASLPYLLLQQEFLLTLKPVPLEVIEEIVDTIFLPAVLAPPTD